MIEGIIKGQELRIITPTIVSDTINYLTARFRFSDDWNGAEKWAHFEQGSSNFEVKLENDEITADKGLNLTHGKWAVYVHGNRFAGGQVTERITTEVKEICVKKTGITDGDPFPDVEASEVERINAELEAVKAGKMEYYILTFDGTAFRHDGAALTFAQIREKCLDTKNFVYAQYENRLYIPAYVSGSNIFFDSAFIQSDVCKMNRISISSSNTVTRVDKVLATNEVYTQIAAVQETVATMRSEVDVLKQDFSRLSESITEISEGGILTLSNVWTKGTYIKDDGTQALSAYGVSTNDFFIPQKGSVVFSITPEYADIYKVNIAEYDNNGTITVTPQSGTYVANNIVSFLIKHPYAEGNRYKVTILRIDNGKVTEDIDWNSVFIVTDGDIPITAVDRAARNAIKNMSVNHWYKWNAIGDSITWLNDNDASRKGYMTRIVETGCVERYINNGLSGWSTPMIAGVINNYIVQDADLTTFEMGTNNFGRCDSIELTKTSCRTIFNALVNALPTKDIVIILPLQRWGYTEDTVKGSQPTMINSDGITLRQYCDAIKSVADEFSLPVIDLYYKSGIIGGDGGNTSQYLADGLHPNNNGFELMANAIYKYLMHM